jgi:hypothetical protein
MKSVLIVIALCSLFIVSSGFTPPAGKPYFAITPKIAPVLQPLDRPKVRAIGKNRAGKMPRWHRVIPGMFR